MSAIGTSILFTAAQIAAALRISPRGVKKRLVDVAPGGRALARGQQALAWTLEQLPTSMRDELAAKARQGCYRDTAHLLADPGAPWRPTIDGKPVTLAELAEHCIVEAAKLERALAPTLKRIAIMPPLPAAEIEASGLAEYKAEFGHAVSSAHWHRLKNRTVERAGWRGEYPLEIFLPAKLAKRNMLTAAPVNRFSSTVHEVCRALLQIENPTAPTAEEKAHLWEVALTEIDVLVSSGADERQARRQIFRTLADSGVQLAKSATALEMSFSRNLMRWKAGGREKSALVDRRRGPRDDARAAWPESDLLIIKARAVEARGRLSLGVRNAMHGKELSVETTLRLNRWFASKSYLPESLRSLLRDEVANLWDIHHGPRQAKLRGAYLERDYSDISPGDVWTADDVTLNSYYWENTPDGPMAMRGQFILFCDVRTSLILSFALHSERNYNARIIRNAFITAHDRYGLPRKALYFERGLWSSARLLKGTARNEITLEDTEKGLRDFVEFRHAHLPRSKTIENTIGKLEDMMDGEVGYVGRAEMTEKFERIQKKLRDAAAGKIEYGSFLYSKEQWIEKLIGYCNRYNNERQDGRRLQKLSPLQAWEKWFDYRDPLTRLEGPTRYLLLNHRCQAKVGQRGVTISWHSQRPAYCNAETSRLRGKEVIVRYDVQEGDGAPPASVTITDLHDRNPIEVPLLPQVASFYPAPGQLSAALSQSAAHSSYQRTAYRAIGPLLKQSMFRRIDADLNTVLLGDAIKEGRAKVRVKDDERQQVARRTSELERELGIRASTPGRDADARLRSLQLLKQADEMEAQENLNDE